MVQNMLLTCYTIEVSCACLGAFAWARAVTVASLAHHRAGQRGGVAAAVSGKSVEKPRLANLVVRFFHKFSHDSAAATPRAGQRWP